MNLSKLSRPNISDDESDSNPFKNDRSNDLDQDRVYPIMNSSLISQSLINRINMSEESTAEVIKDFEVGFLLYMKGLMENIIQISEQSKRCDEKIHALSHNNPKSSVANSALVNDVIDKFKNAEKRELKIQDFYDCKIKNNREKEEKDAKEKVNMNLTDGPTEKAKSKGFNEVA